MDFKQAIIENAWAGINIDYGMLHLQLATPTAVLVVILVMVGSFLAWKRKHQGHTQVKIQYFIQISVFSYCQNYQNHK